MAEEEQVYRGIKMIGFSTINNIGAIPKATVRWKATLQRCDTPIFGSETEIKKKIDEHIDSQRTQSDG